MRAIVSFVFSFVNLFSSYAVTFSRIDPGGKLVMGFRKASNSVDMQVKPHSNILQSETS